jgi:hypothetical protein
VLTPAQTNAAGDWPREIRVPEGTVVIYQPQPEKLDGNRLMARAAVAVKLKSSKEPVFGAIWFDARLDTDRATRTAIIADVSVIRVRFPNQDEKKTQKLGDLLEKEIPKWQLPISLDQLLATLDMAEQRTEDAQKIKTDPPKILFISEPAVLITIDGEPKLKEEKGSELKRVINTPFTILFDPSTKTYYLFADKKTWYAASDIQGDWAVVKKVPSEVAAHAPKADPDATKQEKKKKSKGKGPAPKIVVATTPTELISSTGKPEFSPITGTDLLYMSNTDSDVLMHIKDQKYYILLAGRWYISAKMEGPWSYLPGEKLPADFAKIPEKAEMGTVLYAVPGTDVANEAVLDTQIPQTAAVERKKATLKVEYDGDPKFEKITDTEMTYAVNTATPVIQVKKKYYACDEAVWFVSDKAMGPWQVATSVPDEIYTISPDSPVYNVTFVRIYSVTDDEEVVYVGYTPGYTHTYVYNTTIVYGTGYYYPGWYGYWYYPGPATWGYCVRYNPWYGWGYGYSYSAGPYTFSIGWGLWFRGGWWGPGRHRGYRRGYRHGYRRGRNAGYRAGYRAGRHNSRHGNMYHSQRNRGRTSAKHGSAGKQARSGASSKRANNVYADRNGNVHRKTNQGWQNRSQGGWNSQQSQAKQQKSRQQQTRQLDSNDRARQQGASRSRSYNRSYGGGGRSYGGGGMRGGGGGRGGGGRC